MDIDIFIRQFESLHVNVNRHYWSAETHYQAPYKPILLLSVLDLIGLGIIQRNFIAFDEELLEMFNLYSNQIVGEERNSGMVLPFFHLRYEHFWDLIPAPNMEAVLAATRQIDSVTQLRKLVLGAKLNDSLFALIRNPTQRDRLKSVLIQNYFVPELKDTLIRIGCIKIESFEYGQELMMPTTDRFKIKDKSSDQKGYHRESRSMAFRSVVRLAYDYTCAMCGIRVLTPEGAAAVQAAHIVPWNISHNDDPRNGMALCGLHHWVFDQGLVCVDGDFRIQISPLIRDRDEGSESLVTLANREIYKPREHYFWPARRALNWHRKNRYRGDVDWDSQSC